LLSAVLVLGAAAFAEAATKAPGALAVVDASTPSTLSLAQAPAADKTGTPTATAPVTKEEVEAKETQEEPKLPVSLAVSYYLLSDYVWRGINLSEYQGEGREKPNHQVTTAIDLDLGPWGTLGFDTFWEWYAAQQKLNPTTGDNLQEIDYVIRWGHSIEPIATDLTLGFSFYTFPNLAALLRTDGSYGNNNNDRDQEWWFKLAHNDAWMWKWLLPENKDGVLNPTFLFAQSVGIGAGHTWMEFSLSHPFTVVENLTVTPGYLVAVDGGVLKRYLGREHADTMRLAYDQWSLNVTYDLTPVLKLPKWAGTLSISGLLYFNNALGTAEDDGSINDEFYGGMSVNWGWGG
jgi:hypothetical protein